MISEAAATLASYAISYRQAVSSDKSVLIRTLVAGVDPLTGDKATSIPTLANFVEHWPNRRDCGYIAEDGRTPVGAALVHFHTRTKRPKPRMDPDALPPEAVIAIIAEY